MKAPARRSFLKTGFLGVAGLSALGNTEAIKGGDPYPATGAGGPPGFKLGLVTYELAKDWDVETIIKNCEATSFEGVELRTTHRHGVEPSISKDQRAEVRKRFEDSRVRLVSLGSTCEYESPDPEVVQHNIDETRRFVELAQDVGCLGVKVRPNGFPKNVPHSKALDQIGRALRQCGDIARDHGVEIWLEVHGRGTEEPQNIHRIMEVCDHPSVGICWNSSDTDVVRGSVKPSFDLLKKWLRSCHINELWRTLPPWRGGLDSQQPQSTTAEAPGWQKPYPWHELFNLFRSAGYNRYTFAEIPASCEPIRLMRYYRALWEYHAA
ncbi:MAG TPA: sugar phosphate isomerase/epimerase family protein [Terriglobia bacterium]|nr:sugar phosphate isomerase/epimerase family protein [Terriglobia bacterium]